MAEIARLVVTRDWHAVYAALQESEPNDRLQVMADVLDCVNRLHGPRFLAGVIIASIDRIHDLEQV